eukprot:TRINITY_DN5608_c0_g2_i1.p1 TRINITY_DN5608_c0_g2~~TRINITY_DN5608_c0_g2_i1.p1  ORF type:complete len:533 (+),score=99.57 TRINITY_DN5608_c0_g2_i1:148-1746(+)
MANHVNNYNPSSYGGGTALSGVYSSDPYLFDSSLMGSSSTYLTSDPFFLNHHHHNEEGLRFSSSLMGTTSSSSSLFSQQNSFLPASAATAVVDPAVSGVKRPMEALYNQNFLGGHNTSGQSEGLFPTYSLAKHPRYESASNLPIYPQRPGEKDCAHYMLTRTCKFGDACKFDHPIWVPEGGIPDWKEVPLIATSESLPERPGEPDCPYFLKTQKCKFSFRCKFNHPKEKVEVSGGIGVGGASETADISVLPERPSEPICSFYMKTGKCKFGANCKFHHPKDIEIPSAAQVPSSGEQNEPTVKVEGTATAAANPVKTSVPFTPALLHNSKGLPVRPGEVDCPFYLKTGSCKYGATCRYNHPDRNAINPPVAGTLGHAIITSQATSLPIGVLNSAASFLPSIDPRLTQTTLGLGPTLYPQRPEQIECDFYMKTGVCKFGERCKYHHPVDRSAPTPSMMMQVVQQDVKLTLAGLPRREGAVICPFYMKTGTCKYGATCRFDHPPPGEFIAIASSTTTGGEEEKEVEPVAVAAVEQ